MNNKLKKVIVFVFVFALVILTINPVFAIVNPGEVDVSSEVEGADQIKEFGGSILGIILTIGVVISIIVLIIIGIKYMFGTVEEKAKYKNVLLPYTIGMILLFAAIPITNTLFKVSQGLDTDISSQGSGGTGKKPIPVLPINARSGQGCMKCGEPINNCKDPNNHPVTDGFICNECGEFFTGKVHTCKSESKNPPIPDILSTYYCKKCDSVGTCDSFEDHFEEHEPMYRCSKCNTIAATKKEVMPENHICVSAKD